MQSEHDLGRLFFPHGEFRAQVLVALIRHRWFIQMRWIIAIAILVLFYVERLYNPSFVRPSAVALCAIALAAINLIWTILSRSLRYDDAGTEAIPPALLTRVVWFVNAQMMVDLLILTVLLRFSGGLESPMVIYYLFHMMIAAMLLRPLNALLQGCWALLLFGGLAAGESLGWIMPRYPFLPPATGTGSQADWTHVIIATGVLAAGICGTLYFTLQISSRLDDQETRLRKTVNVVRRSQEAIQDLQARRSRFMETAAHQLKGPLAGVQTLAGLIRDDAVPADAVRPTCERIVERCRQAISQVAELLTLARIQQADPTRHRYALADLGQIVQEQCQRYAPSARDRHIRLGCEVPEDADLRVQVDGTSLSACVGSLIDNALAYTGAGGKVTVAVTRGYPPTVAAGVSPTPQRAAADSGQFVTVSVTDTGMGIEPEELVAAEDPTRKGSIFDAFRRGNNALAAGIPGTGVGLAIVQEVAEQAGGRIIVRSQPGQGSTFAVTFSGRRAEPDEHRVQDTRSSIIVVKPADDADSTAMQVRAGQTEPRPPATGR
jgi:signal transduction histidine kinase